MQLAPEFPSTRDRLLDAATAVCALKGLRGATTREIAEAAQVNEVTLFRHFGSKEKLIGALVQRSVASQIESLEETEPLDNELEHDLLCFACRFSQTLFEHEPLIRAIIGEVRQYPDEARQVIHDAGKPLRDRLRAYLAKAQKSGSVRSDLKLDPAVDAFTGMLLSGMLKLTAFPQQVGYGREEHLITCMELFVRGIEAKPGGRS